MLQYYLELFANYGKSGKMKENIEINLSENPAKSFGSLIKKLELYAKHIDKPITEVIDMFVLDVKNCHNEDYEKNIESIVLKNISPNATNSIISYLNKVKRTYKQLDSKEKKEADREKAKSKWLDIQDDIDKHILSEGLQTGKDIINKMILDINEDDSSYELPDKEKRFVLKKLKNKLADINRKEQDEEKARKGMDEIEKVLNREDSNGNIVNKVDYLESIKRTIVNKKNMGEEVKIHLLKLVDERINEENDQIYYDQVKEFTNNFQFLREYSEIVRATKGYRSKKFTDKKAYDRFCSLREKLQKGYRGEESKINELLKDENIDNADRRILESRMQVMEKEASQVPGAR